MKRRLLYTVIALLFAAAGSLAAAAAAGLPWSPGAMAMGNTWVANGASADAPVFNPAFFYNTGHSLTLVRMSVGLNPDAMKLFFSLKNKAIQYSQESDISSIPEDFVSTMNNIEAKYLYTGPLFFLYRGEGYGLAVYNSTQGTLRFSGMSLPEGSVSAHFDWTGLAAIAYPLPLVPDGKLIAGINLKYIIRFLYEAENVPFSDIASILSPRDYKIPFLLGQGLGSDLGVVYNHSWKLSFAATLHDWFGTVFSWVKYTSNFEEYPEEIEDTRIIPALSLGMSYRIARVFGIDDDILSNTRIIADVRDIFREKNSFFNMLHFGVETRILHTFTARAGLNQGYFTFGFSWTLAETLKLEFSHFAEEAGMKPGQNKAAYQTFSVSLHL